MSTQAKNVDQPKASGTPAPESPEQKKEGESKGGVFEIVKAPFVFAWDKIILNIWGGIKHAYGAIKDSVVSMYEREKSLFKQMGAGQYILSRIGKIGFKLLKLAIAVIVVQMILNFAGISLFDPMTLLVILAVAVVAVAASSYLAQKKLMNEASFKGTVAGVFEGALAA